MSDKIDKLTTGDVEALFKFYAVNNKDDLIQMQYEHITQLQKSLYQCNKANPSRKHITDALISPRKA